MVLEQITGVIDFVLSPLTIFESHISIVIISLTLTLIIIGLNRIFINKSLVKDIKNKMESIRENLAQAQKTGSKEETQKFLSDLMKTNNEYMKHTFKTLIISIVIISIFLPWLSGKYEGAIVAFLPFALPVIGTGLTWLYWYILVSITIGWVIRKVFGVE